MNDVATLGLRIDSRQAVTARAALDRLAPSAKRAESEYNRLQRQARGVASTLPASNKAMAEAARRSQTLSRHAGAAASSMRTFWLAIGGGVALRSAQAAIDANIRIGNSLRVAGLEGAELERVYDRLLESANRNVAPFETLASLYGRAALAQDALGASGEELLSFVDNIAVGLRVAGQSAEQSRGALIQLSQAIGAGIVRAEEFNAILEGALPIAQAAALGLKEAGGSVANLRTLIIEGKVSSEAFFRAFQAGAPMLQQKVVSAEVTFSQSMTRMQNVLIDAAGKLNEATGASRAMAEWLGTAADRVQYFADRIDTAADYARNLYEWISKLNDMGAFRFLPSTVTGGVEILKSGTALLDLQVESAKAEERRAAGLAKLREELEGLHEEQSAGAAGAIADADGRFVDAFGGGRIDPVSLADYAIDGDKVDADAARAKKAIDRVVESLAFETAQLGRTARQQEVFNQLQAAGVDLSSEYGMQIALAAGQLYDMEQAQDAAAERMETLHDLAGGFFSDLRSGLHDGETAFDALGNAVGRLRDRLLDMVADQAIQSLLGSIGGIAFGGGAAMPYTGGVGSASTGYVWGGVNHSGYGPGDSMPYRPVPAAAFGSIGPGERAAVVRNDESILTPGQMRTMGGAGGGVPVTVNLHNAPAGTTATARQTRGPGGLQLDIELHRQVDDMVAGSIDSGESATNQAIERRYGARSQL